MRLSRKDRSTRDRALSRAGMLALATGALVLIGLGGASVLLGLHNEDALALANQTEEARVAIADVVTSVRDAETGQRGFLLTERESYLELYRVGAARLPGQMDTLIKSLPLADEERRLVADLNVAIQEKMSELRRTLDLAQAGDREAALAVVRSARSQQAIDTIRDLATKIEAEEQSIHERQIRAVNAGGRLLVIADAAGLPLVLLLALGTGLGVRRYLLALRWARTELTVANAMLAGANRRLEEANDGLEARVRTRTADLTEANEEIQRFAYIVSHDLRAPLVNIMGFTGELEDATRRLSAFVDRAAERAPDAAMEDVRLAARDDMPEAIRFIKASSAKMDRLINAILRLSREGRRALSPERIEMAPFVRDILDSVRHQVGRRDAEITVSEMPDIVADRLVVEQVFSNLIENALKYLKPGRPGQIGISGHVTGETVTYTVRDNGRGIAARDHERIFELFRRAGTQDVAGEGIGLAHVRALVRRLHGTIDCESSLDVGSAFIVTLPHGDAGEG